MSNTKKNSFGYHKISMGMLILISILLLGTFFFQTYNLLLGSTSQPFLNPKTCFEVMIFNRTDLPVSSDIDSFIINQIPQKLDINEKALAVKGDCYYAKDVLALREAMSQEESIALLTIFVPLFGLLFTVMSYFRVDAWKKEIEEIRKDTKQETSYLSRSLRRIEEVGAKYSSYIMQEESQVENEQNKFQAAFEATQAGREVENVLLTLSNNSSSDNGKANISLKSLEQYVSAQDIKNNAPYLEALRSILRLIEAEQSTSEKSKASINHFIYFLDGKSPFFEIQ